MANLTFDRLRHYFFLVQNAHTAADEEWDAWLRFAVQGGPGTGGAMRVVVFTAGASPTAKQRSKLHALVPKSGDGVPNAIVTSSLVSRAAVGAISLFNKNVRAFSPLHVADAFTFLGVPEAQHRELLDFARALHQRIGLTPELRL